MTTEQIEEAAGGCWEEVNRILGPINPHTYALGFRAGVKWSDIEGYRFTEEDMRAAYSAGAEDEYTGRDFDKWLKERRKNK